MRTIRSFVLREGRLTPGQKHALDTHWPIFGLDYDAQWLDWTKVFPNPAPLVIEIGFGNGDSLIRLAAEKPELNFLGIEVHRPGVGRVLAAAHEQNLNNIRVMTHDAVEVLKNQVPPRTVHAFVILFPDPWHKKRHHKRRLINETFCKQIFTCLENEGYFVVATDWPNYAEQIQACMQSLDEHFELTGIQAESIIGDQTTKFEARGERLGHPIWKAVYQKRFSKKIRL